MLALLAFFGGNGALAMQFAPPIAASKPTGTPRATTIEAFDLYPPPNAPKAPGADGWFKDFGKQKLDPAMLKAAGISDKKSVYRSVNLYDNKKSNQVKKKATSSSGDDTSAGVPGGLLAAVAALLLAVGFAVKG